MKASHRRLVTFSIARCRIYLCSLDIVKNIRIMPQGRIHSFEGIIRNVSSYRCFLLSRFFRVFVTLPKSCRKAIGNTWVHIFRAINDVAMSIRSYQSQSIHDYFEISMNIHWTDNAIVSLLSFIEDVSVFLFARSHTSLWSISPLHSLLSRFLFQVFFFFFFFSSSASNSCQSR